MTNTELKLRTHTVVYVNGKKIEDKYLQQMIISKYEPIRLLALELIELRSKYEVSDDSLG